MSNNPLLFVDPTGHFGRHNDDKSDYWNKRNQEKVKQIERKGEQEEALRELKDLLAAMSGGSKPYFSMLADGTPPPVPPSAPTATGTPYPPAGTPAPVGVPTPPGFIQPPTGRYIVDWSRFDLVQAGIDVAGIGGDLAFVFSPLGPGPQVEAAVTIVEVAAAGKAVYDTVNGDPRNLSMELVVHNLEHNPLLVARLGRAVPVIGAIASGYSLYDNFHNNLTVTYVAP